VRRSDQPAQPDQVRQGNALVSERNDGDRKTSRRGFLGAAASAGAALTSPLGRNAVAAPFQTRVASAGASGGRVGVAMPARPDMDSGAPLGGIGTGLLEIRPDGGFHEWQIFKPDIPRQMLTIAPKAPGDFHAPWVMGTGFGQIARTGRMLSVSTVAGTLAFRRLQVDVTRPNPVARLSGRAVSAKATRQAPLTMLEFAQPVSIEAGQTLTIA
jgi:hypothetical protein